MENIKDIIDNIKITFFVIITVAAAYIIFFNIDYFIAVIALYGHYLFFGFFLLPFLVSIILKLKKSKMNNPFDFLYIFSLITLIVFLFLYNNFYNIRNLEPNHISIIKFDEAFENKDLELAMESIQYTNELRQNKINTLIMLNKLYPSEKVSGLINQRFISKKEFSEVEAEFLLEHKNTKDTDTLMLINLLKQKKEKNLFL